MRSLIEKIRKLKQSGVRKVVDRRINGFSRPKQSDELFSELCFCILTANYSAEGGIRIQEAIGKGFCTLPKDELVKELKRHGHRFPNTRAGYVHEARAHLPKLKKTIESFNDDKRLREWVVKNVKGLGYKEASHFLRNIGHRNLAIIDFHIVDLLVAEGLIREPKTLTPNKYLEIESVLEELGKKVGMNMAELDLYLWYMETGKVLK